MHKSLLVVVLALVALVGSACEVPSHCNVHLTFVPDESRSIEASARKSCLDDIGRASLQLARGDSFEVIAVTDDTVDSAPRELLRFRFPETREPFDGDLTRVVASERDGLALIASAKPYERTDLLGTVRLVSEEFVHDPPQTVRAIAILSDFIEDRGDLNFMRNKRLADPRSARLIADKLTTPSTDLQGVKVFLGELPSVSLGRLPDPRREAIRAFWMEYFRREGADAEWATDGAGELTPFVSRLTADAADNSMPVAAIIGPSLVAQEKPAQGQGS